MRFLAILLLLAPAFVSAWVKSDFYAKEFSKPDCNDLRTGVRSSREPDKEQYKFTDKAVSVSLEYSKGQTGYLWQEGKPKLKVASGACQNVGKKRWLWIVE